MAFAKLGTSQLAFTVKPGGSGKSFAELKLIFSLRPEDGVNCSKFSLPAVSLSLADG